MKFVFAILGILLVLMGLSFLPFARSVMHDIAVAVIVIGGLNLMAAAWLIEAVTTAADRIVAAIDKLE